ncbi:hypothetical protein GCM10008957_28040 [Deinococcus ruber]|uniref:THIF-type NAD/FAD binding fold domain-containing protein n=2 Tax=Deinococcus ruber TaxID=1848197 RepID=A0A918CAP5_9DEIO|nr:hypothetical protein GCM10008957_28040 [Deinococcus ruber]
MLCMHLLTFNPRERLLITLIGVGGTGSLILTHLVRLDQAIRALGGQGLQVRAFDPDAVSETNLTRQNFAPADVGRNKAVVLVERCNLFAGLTWQAFPRCATSTDFQRSQHVVISCVDTGQARREIGAALGTRGAHYWLDCGNDAAQGQVVLGQLQGAVRLPHILEVDPSGMQGVDDDRPSCSALEALTRQHLFINPAIALQAAQLLGELLLHAGTEVQAVYVNLRGVTRVMAKAVGEQPRLPQKAKRAVPLLPTVQQRAPRPRRSRKQPAA